MSGLVLAVEYLSCASRFVVADLVLEVIFENISDCELLPMLMDTGHRISDGHSHSTLLYNLQIELDSTDLTWQRKNQQWWSNYLAGLLLIWTEKAEKMCQF